MTDATVIVIGYSGHGSSFFLGDFAWLLWVFIVARTFSLVAGGTGWGSGGLLPSYPAWASHCDGFSCCGAWAGERVGFGSCGPQA